MDSRDLILSRLRGEINSGLPEPTCPPSQEIFADLPATDQLVATFIERLSALRGNARIVPDLSTAASVLTELIAGKSSFAAAGPLISSLLREDPALQNKVSVMNDVALRQISNQSLAAFDIGITEADSFIARTGSIGISQLDRRVSLFPAHHIVVGQIDQVCASIADWLTQLPVLGQWSSATLITGPSRTADIEKILVLGAHGPKELSVVLIG